MSYCLTNVILSTILDIQYNLPCFGRELIKKPYL